MCINQIQTANGRWKTLVYYMGRPYIGEQRAKKRRQREELSSLAGKSSLFFTPNRQERRRQIFLLHRMVGNYRLVCQDEASRSVLNRIGRRTNGGGKFSLASRRFYTIAAAALE